VKVAAAFVLGLALGTAVAVIHGDELPSDDVLAAAQEANVDPLLLLGAVNTTHLEPRTYLYAVHELEPPVPPSLRDYAYQAHPDVAWCIEQIVKVESNGWYTRGWNPIPVGREHASGLGGFLPSTWASTPQGRAGASIWDGYAQVDGIAFMLHAGRGREFAAVAWGRCR